MQDPLRLWSLSLAALLATLACDGPAGTLYSPAAAPSPTPTGVHFSGKLPLELPSSTGRDDLDGDGADDCWQARWEGGSGAGGVLFEVWSPCTASPWALDTTSSFGEFLAPTSLPPALAARPRLLEGVVDLLFGRAHLRRVDSIDGSFRWLLEHRLTAASPAAPPFIEARRYTPVWSPGRPAIPPSQVLILSDAAYAPLLSPPSRPVSVGPYALVAYFAHNHGEFAPAIACGSRSVIATRHGVAVYDRDRDEASWVYISTGVSKLRHASLGRVACVGDLVAVERSQDGLDELVVVSPSAGRYGSILLEGPYRSDEHGLSVGGETYSPGRLAEALGGPSSP